MLHCPRMTVRTIAYSGIFLASVMSSAFAADPTGDWRVADGVANIRVAQCNGSMWGAVAWEKTPGGRDTNNPDARQAEPADARHANPDRHEEESRAPMRGKAKSITPRTGSFTVRPSSRLEQTNWKSRVACWASCAAAKPGPASGPRFPPARPTAWPRARRRTGNRRSARRRASTGNCIRRRRRPPGR